MHEAALGVSNDSRRNSSTPREPKSKSLNCQIWLPVMYADTK